MAEGKRLLAGWFTRTEDRAKESNTKLSNGGSVADQDEEVKLPEEVRSLARVGQAMIRKTTDNLMHWLNTEYPAAAKKLQTMDVRVCVAVVTVLLYAVYRLSGSVIHAGATLIIPAYFTVKALESQQTEDMHRWLKYWIIYAALGLLSTLDPVLYYMPMYGIAKEAVLIWCAYPQPWNGTEFVFNKLSPAFVKFQQFVREIFTDALL